MNDVLSPADEDLGRGLAMASDLMRKGFVSTADVAPFRRECFAERSACRAEAEALFALDRSLRPQSRAWVEFLVEVVTDHVVWDARPTGILTAADAEWLLRLADASRSAAAFAVLLNVLDQAHRVPNDFVCAVRKRAAEGWHGDKPVHVAAPTARAA